MKFEKSIAAYKEAEKIMPGGVNSPVRAFKSVNANPIFIDHGKDAYLYDIDGNKYIDYVLSWGPLILGHADDKVVKALTKAATKGTSFGAPTEIETRLTKLVVERVPTVEMLRMVNSGTEATMSALRLARGATGRDKILKFEGCYHGHSDSLLVKAGSGVATFGLPDSPGVPAGTAENTLTIPYNDFTALEQIFSKMGEEIAAVIIEPVAGNMGCVPTLPGYHEKIRELTKQYGTLLIFDEVMTGFRVGFRGAAGLYGIEPDLICFGKIIGGGLPVAAYGGKRELMSQIAPSGPIYQAGTLSGNPLAMTAGLATLEQLSAEDYHKMERLVEKLLLGLSAAAEKHHIALQTAHVGAMFGYFFTDQVVTNFERAKSSDTALFARFFKKMLAQGIYLAPSQFESGFISTKHSESDIDMTIAAAEIAFAEIEQENTNA